MFALIRIGKKEYNVVIGQIESVYFYLGNQK